MGVEEAQALLIAAHPWDVHGAKRAGLRAGWVNRRGQPYPEVFAPPDVSAGDLPALARALAG
jgi:2-haloacid dehalogenase